MKIVQLFSAVCLLSSSVLAAPPKGGWDDKGDDKWDDKGDDKWDNKWDGSWGKTRFTSTYSVTATPNQVINQTENGAYVRTGGLKGAIGYYDFGINSDEDVLCYKIRLYGFRGQYQSLAKTATHIHEAPRGKTGPPRIAMKNPVKTGKGDERVSSGCLKAPFTTGVIDTTTGQDTGAGFSVAEIEANPRGFFCDVHSSLAVPGAVRGQLG